MNRLAYFKRAKQELALVTKIDEVKVIRDKAENLCVLMRSKLVSLLRCRITVQRQRKGGEIPEILGNPGKHGKHTGAATSSHDVRALTVPKLNERGTGHKQSSRWQAIDDVPAVHSLLWS